MQTVSQPTTRSGIYPPPPHRQLPLLFLSPPNVRISVSKSWNSKLLLSLYDSRKHKRPELFSSRVSASPVSKLFSSRVFSSPVSPGFSSTNDEIDKAHAPKVSDELLMEVVRTFFEQCEICNCGVTFFPDICLKLASLVLMKNAAKGSNTVISPFSFYLWLSLIAAGSKGDTLLQLLNSLKSESLEDLRSLSSKMISHASPANESGPGNPDSSFFKGVWFSEGLKLKPFFQEIAKVVFNATAKEVNFVNNVVAEINVWAETATRDLIKNMLTSEALKSIDKDTALILANAISFKGTWAQSFDTSKNKNRPFYLENGQTVDVPFMTCEKYESFHFFEMNDYRILKLPFNNCQSTGEYAIYFFLPNDRDGFQRLVKEVTGITFKQRFYLPLTHLSEIWIPKFKFSFEFEASGSMKELGLSLPFDSTKAEITEILDSSRRLNADKMFHKAFIEVNEERTEAAVDARSIMFDKALIEVNEERTEVATDAKSRHVCLSNPSRSFVADHPFIFMIREETSEDVFFVGAVSNPLLQS